MGEEDAFDEIVRRLRGRDTATTEEAVKRELQRLALPVRDREPPAEPGKDPDDETKDDGDEQHRHVDRMERRCEPAREVAKDLHLEGKYSRVVQEAFGKAHSEADLEDGENDDREDHRDRPDPPYLVAP